MLVCPPFPRFLRRKPVFTYHCNYPQYTLLFCWWPSSRTWKSKCWLTLKCKCWIALTFILPSLTNAGRNERRSYSQPNWLWSSTHPSRYDLNPQYGNYCVHGFYLAERKLRSIVGIQISLWILNTSLLWPRVTLLFFSSIRIPTLIEPRYVPWIDGTSGTNLLLDHHSATIHKLKRDFK